MFEILANQSDAIQALAAILGLIGVIIGLVYADFQFRATKRSTQGNFLLQFDQMLQTYDKVHKLMRPIGDWRSGKKKIEEDDWPDIERYMGIFERIKILIDDKFINLAVFDRLYGYRIDNILKTRQILNEKLIKRAYGWQDFIHLTNALYQDRINRKDELAIPLDPALVELLKRGEPEFQDSTPKDSSTAA